MRGELLLEIGVEEIPAGFLPPAFADLEERIKNALKELRLSHGAVKATGTPRRLTVMVEQLDDCQSDLEEERIGPPVKAAFDQNGDPTKAAVGFAAKVGVEIDKLARVKTEKGEYLAANVTIHGKKTVGALAETLPHLIENIYWRKSMRWGYGTATFARPIRWLLALYGGEIIPFEIEGVKTSNTTLGHRFMAPSPVKVKDYADYSAQLEKAYVMVEHEKRLQFVIDSVNKKAEELKGIPACREELFEEVTFMVEWPALLSATFPEKYLDLPAPVLIAAMTGHQRYFPLKNKDGNLLNHFIIVSNMPAKEMDVIARGNERVLNARLADAEFFYKQDMKKTPDELLEELRGVIFLKDVGSYREKANRIERLALDISHWVGVGADRPMKAASLCKIDLVTEMVREFPSLQGTIGKIYLSKSKEFENWSADAKEEIAIAVEEHYLPRSTADIRNLVLPKTITGACVAIADRVDSIAACFAVGLVPKGDQDPYALRRGVLGILAIIESLNLKLPIKSIIDLAVRMHASIAKKTVNKLVDDMEEFIRERIRQQIISKGAAPDAAEAAIRSGFDDYLDVLDKAASLNRFRKRPDFDDLATSFRRVGNILEGVHRKRVDESLFNHDSEKELYNAFLKLKDKVEKLAQKRDYFGALELMAELRPQVDRFFDDVLVNDPDDEARRANRHTLLYNIHRMFLNVADFSALSR